ncbi:unnamed protein product [Ascophyllum nodosum]
MVPKITGTKYRSTGMPYQDWKTIVCHNLLKGIEDTEDTVPYHAARVPYRHSTGDDDCQDLLPQFFWPPSDAGSGSKYLPTRGESFVRYVYISSRRDSERWNRLSHSVRARTHSLNHERSRLSGGDGQLPPPGFREREKCQQCSLCTSSGKSVSWRLACWRSYSTHAVLQYLLSQAVSSCNGFDEHHLSPSWQGFFKSLPFGFPARRTCATGRSHHHNKSVWYSVLATTVKPSFPPRNP